MELRYEFMVPVGIFCILVFGVVFLVFKNKKRTYKSGIRVANAELLAEEPFLKRKILLYRILKWSMAAFLAMGILFTCILLAQPYTLKITKENKYNRDIMICLDVSTSVDELNKKLVKELEDTVRGLSGERVGIIIFNTSPVLAAPLTDDYEFIIEQLESIRKGLAVSEGNHFYDDDWYYWSNYLYSGTLVDNDIRGSSLIGDGLLSAALNFSGNDEKRTQIVIFATDNDINGESFVTLSEAAQICKQNDIIVYGIGTKSMYREHMNKMKTAVEMTGGKFYLEEDSDTFYKIVREIESKSASLVKGKTVIDQVPHPEKFFGALVLCAIGVVFCGILLRQMRIFWILRQVCVALLLAAVFATVVYPAKNMGFGEKQDIKYRSDMQVLFVIDGTLSMLADDADEKHTQRLSAIQEDCAYIIEELEGADFAVINFHNQATLMSPYTSNSAHIQNTIDSIYPIETWYAKGSSLNTPKELMLKNLKEEYEKKGKKVAVFFMSDGEITDETTLESYRELAQYVEGGAVMGYGTKKGGTMTYTFSYSNDTEKVYDYSDFSGEPAVSKIDETNLKAIAKDLGTAYVPMHDKIALNAVLTDLKKNLNPEIDVEGDRDKTGEETDTQTNEMKTLPGYWLLVPLLCLFLAESWIFVTDRKHI